MKKLFSAALVIMVIMTVGCISAPIIPPIGILYDDISAPIDIDYDETKIMMRKGEATCISYVGLVSVGDCSTKAAAANGGIQKVHHADYRFQNIIFGIVQKLTVQVYGE